MICSDRATAESPGSYNKTFCTTYKWCTQRHALERAQSCQLFFRLFFIPTNSRFKHIEMDETAEDSCQSASARSFNHFWRIAENRACEWRWAIKSSKKEEFHSRVLIIILASCHQQTKHTNKTHLLSISFRSGVSWSSHKEQARYCAI